MNWKGCERKRPRPNLRNYAGIYMKVLSKTTKSVSYNRPCKRHVFYCPTIGITDDIKDEQWRRMEVSAVHVCPIDVRH